MSSHVNQLGHQVTFTSSSYTEFPGCPMTLDSQKKTGIFLMELFSEINFCWQYMTEKTKIYLQPSHVTTWILPVNPEICLLGWKASKKMQWRGRILPRLCATDVVVADTRTCLRSHVLRFPVCIYICIYVIICKEKPHYTETQAKRLKTLQEKDIEAFASGAIHGHKRPLRLDLFSPVDLRHRSWVTPLAVHFWKLWLQPRLGKRRQGQ